MPGGMVVVSAGICGLACPDFIDGGIEVRCQRREAVTGLGDVIHQFAGVIMRACRQWRGGWDRQSVSAWV